MGLFKKKRKVEEIAIEEIKLEEPVIEETKKVEEPVKEVFPKSSEEAVSLINKKCKELDRNYDSLIYNYYICKFFSLAVFTRVDELHDIASLEKQLTNLRLAYEDISAKLKKVNENNDYSNDYLEELFIQSKSDNEICLGLLNRVNETRRVYFNSLKISSMAVLLNKTGEDLEKMDRRFMTLVNSFKSLEEASDYIYVNSGELITNLVNSLVRCSQTCMKEEHKNQFNLYYFLKSDVILCLQLNEWIELYNKVKHCVNVLRGVDIANYIDFQGYLDEFEIRYLVLMINEEKKNRKRRLDDEKDT